MTSTPEPALATRPIFSIRAQFSCGHYRALTTKEAGEDFTQIGVDCYCLVCGKKRQVTRRESIK